MSPSLIYLLVVNGKEKTMSDDTMQRRISDTRGVTGKNRVGEKENLKQSRMVGMGWK